MRYDSIADCLAVSDDYTPVIFYDQLLERRLEFASKCTDLTGNDTHTFSIPDWIYKPVNNYIEQGGKDIIVVSDTESFSYWRDWFDHSKSKFLDHINNNNFRLIVGSSGRHNSNNCLTLGFDLKNAIWNNLNKINCGQIWDDYQNKKNKPFKFLYLNGSDKKTEMRGQIFNEIKNMGLLDSSLHSFQQYNINLPKKYQDCTINVDCNLASTLLDDKKTINGLVHDAKAGWPYINTDAIIDTYFSLVTETRYLGDDCFITDKTWKPIMAKHPFIIMSIPGTYSELHRQGYKTFGSLIDESFDSVDDPTDRMHKTLDVIKDLCSQDLVKFMEETKDICEHNSNRFTEELSQQHITIRNLWKRILVPQRYSRRVQPAN